MECETQTQNASEKEDKETKKLRAWEPKTPTFPKVQNSLSVYD